jgi:hypothetical protein
MTARLRDLLAGAFLLLLAAFPLSGSSGREPPLEDFTTIKLADYGIQPVKPAKDPRTGFIVGGKNATALIEGLTEINGRSIAELEKVMRPGASSRVGFLGKEEKLLEILAADNRYVVDEAGLTHQELAHHLHALGAVWRRQMKDKHPEAEFLYHGRKFKVKGVASRGFQDSPFEDGTRSGSDVTIHNLSNGKKLACALLVPYMVERYGFYEGKGTSYRVDPRQVVEVFDFLTTRKKKD